MRLVVSSSGGAAQVCVEGDVDPETAPGLRTAALEALAAGASSVVFDLAGVTFLDSAGLSTIVAIHRAAQEQGGRATICAVSPIARRVLTLTGVDQLVKLEAPSTRCASEERRPSL